MFRLNLGKRLSYIYTNVHEGSNQTGYGLLFLALMCFGFAALLILMDVLAKYLLYMDMNERLMNVLGVCILGILAIILIFGKDE